MSKNWKILEETDVSPSKWFPLFKHKVELPNGKIVEDYYLSKLGDVSMVVALTKNNEVVFVKQYKHGAGEQILELPAGRVDNKSPEEAAVTELEEETGFVVQGLEPLGFIYAAPTKDTTKTYGFLVKSIDIQNKQNLEETEDIEVVLIPINKINEMVLNGEIKASDTLAVLNLAQRRFPELFKSN